MAALLLAIPVLAAAQAMYKYRGENGEWFYTDRPPDDGRSAEVRTIARRSTAAAGVSVNYRIVGRELQVVARNGFHAPVELKVVFDVIRGLEYPDPDDPLRWVLPPASDTPVVRLGLLEDTVLPYVEFRYQYFAGDPAARHRADTPYRVPFAIATNHPVTQAFPDAFTHMTADSRYAVDIAVPVGTDVFAARDGVVFDVSSTNFRSGTDPRDLANANIVRILHDDGTYALYAHLNWNSIRVQPGDRVRRGEYIADSGNTGFSTGPHLHFAVMKNDGLEAVSVPVRFQGADASEVAPATGQALTAY